MGATIDYGILYTNYYLESRRTMGVKAALIVAYEGSIHTILTSGLILILFMLPAILALMDKLIVRKKKKNRR